MVKKYLDFIKESDESGELDDFTSKDLSNYNDVIEEIKKMKPSEGNFDSLPDSYFKNESDIYDFYIKWRMEIDEVLNSIKFFDQSPKEEGADGLYNYVIKGTKKAFLEFIKMIK